MLRGLTLWRLGALAVALLVTDARSTGAAQIDVVASIKPVHSLVAGVMQGVGEPALLVKGTGSEHSYSLRPSEARALEQAAVVFWVGETMETFLVKPLRALAGNATVIEAWEVPGLTLLATREGGMWEEHEHGDEHADADADHSRPQPVGQHEGEREHAEPDHEEAGEPARGETDMHIWLDPANAKVLVAAIARVLGEADPDNASTYLANAGRLHEQLDELDRSLADRLATVAERPYVVFHDAYQYFEQRYGVRAVGAITINPRAPERAASRRDSRAAARARGGVRVRRAAIRAGAGGHPDRGHERQQGRAGPTRGSPRRRPRSVFPADERACRLPGELPGSDAVGLRPPSALATRRRQVRACWPSRHGGGRLRHVALRRGALMRREG
jgi:zinc transport system substrate-binding protein